MTPDIHFRPKRDADIPWISRVASSLWGSTQIISKDHVYDILSLPNFIEVRGDKPVGFVMYAKVDTAYEIVALYSEFERQGIGTSLLDQVKNKAKLDGRTSVWLLTTNDNMAALRFYQKRGFVITGIRINVMKEQRKRKPVPQLGNDGIPIRDEIELAINL